jgi:acyl-CoA synthetase (AMP-forming)/AMP-acid ligase II
VTGEYIAFHAAERPDAVAILDNGRSITYAEFARDIRKLAHALRALDMPRGSRVAIDCDDTYSNWLLRLAFERLRVVAATVELPDRPDALGLMRDFDIVLSDKSFPPGTGPRYHATTAEWLQGVLAGGEEDQEPTAEKLPDDPIRIVLTSGTTGRSKKLLFTRRRHESLITNTIWFAGLTRQSRYLLALSLTVGGPAACFRVGGTVVIETRMSVGEAIVAHGITHTTLPPFTLKRVLDELRPDFAKPAELTILSFGAGISRALRERALARLATDVCDMYSSNEAGFVSSARGTAEIGTVWPGVRVEVVDEHDRPLPFGEAGRIRVQTDCMLDGYIDDPQTTARIFRNGWFYAADIGILHDAHRLQVIGRSDDVLNIGWRKIAPETIEDMVLKVVKVGDVGVCSVPNADGIEEICIAVSSPPVGDEELLRRITDAFRGFQFGRFRVIKVPDIPRTPNGKLQRKILKDAVARVVRESSAR